MSNVFIARCDAEHLDRTVRSAVDLSEYAELPDALSGMETASFLGVPEGTSTERNFEKMGSGDLVLFYDDGTYVGTGWVGTTFEDDGWASELFWGEDLPYVFTVTEFEAISVPRARVNAIFGYNAGYSPQDLFRIADDRVTHSPEAIKLALRQYTERND